MIHLYFKANESNSDDLAKKRDRKDENSFINRNKLIKIQKKSEEIKKDDLTQWLPDFLKTTLQYLQLQKIIGSSE